MGSTYSSEAQYFETYGNSNGAFVCSWTLESNSDLEVRIFNTSEKVFCFLHDMQKDITLNRAECNRNVFQIQQCIWKGSSEKHEGRLFKNKEDGKDAFCLFINLESLKLMIHIWKNYPRNLLKEKEITLSTNNEDRLQIEQNIERKERILTWYEPDAEVGMMRKKHEVVRKQGEQESKEQEFLEKVLKIWTIYGEVRLVEQTFKHRPIFGRVMKQLACQVFDRKSNIASPVKISIEKGTSFDFLPRNKLSTIQLKTFTKIKFNEERTPELVKFSCKSEHLPYISFMKGLDLRLVSHKHIEEWTKKKLGLSYGIIEAKRAELPRPLKTISIKDSGDMVKNEAGTSTKVKTFKNNPLSNVKEPGWEIKITRSINIITFPQELWTLISNFIYDNNFEIDRDEIKKFICGVDISEGQNEAYKHFQKALEGYSTVIFRIANSRSFCEVEIDKKSLIIFISNSEKKIKTILDFLQSERGKTMFFFICKCGEKGMKFFARQGG